MGAVGTGPPVPTALHAAVHNGGLSLEKNSLLRSAQDMLVDDTGAPGEFEIFVTRSNRDKRHTPTHSMKSTVQEIMRKGNLGVPDLGSVVCLVSPVIINGRKYTKDDFVEFVINIPRREVSRNLNLVNDQHFYKVGRILEFFLVPTNRDIQNGGEVFLSLVEVPISSTYMGCRYMDNPHDMPPSDEDGHINSLNMHYIHVDSVLFKMKVVPDVGNEPKHVGIRIWEAI